MRLPATIMLCGLAIYAQFRGPYRAIPAVSPGANLQPSDLTFLGFKRVDGWGASNVNSPPTQQDHNLAFGGCLDQNGNFVLVFNNMEVGTEYSGYDSFDFYTDNGIGYNTNWQSASFITPTINWGWSSGAPYDMWHGQFGNTYFSDGSLGPGGGGAMIHGGLGCHYDPGTNKMYAYIGQGLNYGNYPPLIYWNIMAASLDNPGTGGLANQTGLATTVYGPFRTCAGVYGPAGSPGSVQECGPIRGGTLISDPNGNMAVMGASGSTQQFHENKGPQYFGGLPWITSGTTSGFGSPRGGNVNYRTTDLIFPTDYVAYYSLDNFITSDGHWTSPAVANWSFRRPAHSGVVTPGGTFSNYTYQGGTCDRYEQSPFSGATGCPGEEIDPNNYSGVGSWTSNEGGGSVVYVGGSKSGLVGTIGATFGPVWYKTLAGMEHNASAQGFWKIFARNGAEADNWTCNSQAVTNDCIELSVTNASYLTSNPTKVVTFAYHNDGASQSLSCTVSGFNIVVHVATDGSSNSTTTASNALSIINSTTACSNIVAADLPAGSSGASIVNTSTITLDYNAQTVPGGVLWLARGALLSPVEDLDTQVTVTGPTGYWHVPAIYSYNMGDLQQTPDYAPDPAWTMWLDTLGVSPNWPCNPMTGSPNPECAMGGITFDPNSRRLYVCMNAVDNGFSKFNVVLPVLAVWQVAGHAAPAPVPVPVPAPKSTSLLAVAAVVAINARRRSR